MGIPNDERPIAIHHADRAVVLRRYRSIKFFQTLAATHLIVTEITAHKLVPGQTIRVHNDYLDNRETHRLLMQFNRGWEDAQGGLLMLFGSASREDVRRILRPVDGSAMAFPISPQSFHAVSTVRHGHRYTLVYSFKAESAA
jgi:Rps23 Pro-64 3,4-dihydroxylase Tpa1-like proline 4-hydroxylase